MEGEADFLNLKIVINKFKKPGLQERKKWSEYQIEIIEYVLVLSFLL